MLIHFKVLLVICQRLLIYLFTTEIMASRTRIGKKNRVFTTSYEPPSDVFSSKASCKGPLTHTTLQANISSSLSKTSNAQVPTPLPQPLRVPTPLSQPQLQLNSSQATTLTHETILNSNDSHSLKRKGRGPTRGKGTDDIVSAAGKISLEISKKLGRAIGNQQARLASECGYVVRSFAPLCYKRWIDIPYEEKNKLYDRVLAKFKLDLTVEHVHKCVNDTLARRYRDYRCRLKEKYFNGKTLDDAMKNCPTDIKQVDWDWLCQYWSTPEFQALSTRNLASHNCIKYNHRGGSKSFVARLQEKRSITKDNARGEIELYYETHYSQKKGATNSRGI
ncbi:uncharacterized protein LOC111411689 isoform X3 [Olea europaea var. sylvestris]|uniref:uncharacterized protein LOC111411689 isoform X3 n=1 Tax=Olea europaea var. sylvestris TaxID=158386 RepID=UPI000C1D2293|nr:uncharacterized protein LOC111411689 isoform X3 [Olea europaea var. sylvestris]